MPSYIFRNQNDHAIRGCVSVSSVDELFNKIDEDTSPFRLHYCEITQNTVWFEDEPVWLMFDPVIGNNSRTLIKASDMHQAIVEQLQARLSDTMFNDYTCFVMARRDLAAFDLEGAVNRIRVDMDKLICLDDALYQYVQHLINDFLR
jgi:hypothetical protein